MGSKKKLVQKGLIPKRIWVRIKFGLKALCRKKSGPKKTLVQKFFGSEEFLNKTIFEQNNLGQQKYFGSITNFGSQKFFWSLKIGLKKCYVQNKHCPKMKILVQEFLVKKC